MTSWLGRLSPRRRIFVISLTTVLAVVLTVVVVAVVRSAGGNSPASGPARLPGAGPAGARAARPRVRRQPGVAAGAGPPDPVHRPPGHRAAPAWQRHRQPGHRRQRAQRGGHPGAARRRTLGGCDRLLSGRGHRAALGAQRRRRAQGAPGGHPRLPVPRRRPGLGGRGLPARCVPGGLPAAGPGQQPAPPAGRRRRARPPALAVAVDHRRSDGHPTGLGPAGGRAQRADPVGVPGPADQPLPAADRPGGHRDRAAGHRRGPGAPAPAADCQA